jgi:hypothetical protein
MRSPAPPKNTPTELLTGLVERVTFHSAENGFCVLRVKACGQRDLVTPSWEDAGRVLDSVEHNLIRRSLAKIVRTPSRSGAEKVPESGRGWSVEAPGFFARVIGSLVLEASLPEGLEPLGTSAAFLTGGRSA